MPPRKMRRLRVPKRKRAARKWVSKSRSTVNVNRALNPIPQRYICKLKYADDVTTDAGGRFNLNLNSLYDPNRTGAGHQPYGFDTLATLYNRYRVISCGWRITAPTTGSQVVQMGALPANNVISIGNMYTIRENPRAKYVVQLPGGGAQTLSGKIYIPSLMGRNKSQYMADDNYQALVTASPAELAILNIFTGTATGAPLVQQNVNVLLEFTVEFFDVVTQAVSEI